MNNQKILTLTLRHQEKMHRQSGAHGLADLFKNSELHIAELEKELFKQSQESKEEVLRAIEIILEKDAKIAELEKTCKSRSDTIIEYSNKIAELEKERFTFKKIISNPAMADQEKYVHIRDMLKEQSK